LSALEFFEPYYDKKNLIFFHDPIENDGEILIINKKYSYLVFSAKHELFINHFKILDNNRNAQMFWRLKPRKLHSTDPNTSNVSYPETYPTKNWNIKKINNTHYIYIKHEKISSLLINYEKEKNQMFLEFASYSSGYWHGETLLPKEEKTHTVSKEKYFLKCVGSYWNNCKGIRVYSNEDKKGGKYEGEFESNTPNGLGTYYFKSHASKYFGKWKNGEYNGKGTFFFEHGEVWEGNWKNSEFIDGKKYKKGMYKLRDCPGSPQTDGDINNWNICIGTYIATVDKIGTKNKNQRVANFNSGSKHTGEWHNNMPNGKGIANFSDGSRYEGNFKNDKMHGKGNYVTETGGGYNGEWKNGQVTGRGVISFDNGNKLVGMFNKGKLAGKGTLIYKSGNQYVGEFKRYGDTEKFEGYGTMTFTNGNKYIGEWKNGEYNGKGIYIAAEGFKYQGEFKNHKLSGTGRAVYINGDKYIGEYKDGVIHGQGTYFYSDGVVKDGKWEKNEWVSGKEYARGKYRGPKVADISTDTLEEKQIEKNTSIDTEPPQIIITSSNIQEKQAVIQGTVSDNIDVAELTIDGELVMFNKKGNFKYSTFIPKEGIALTIEVIDSKGITSQKLVTLERNETAQIKKINFTKLNPLSLKGKRKKDALALIIGIGDYENAPEAKYAERDANYFSDFAESVLGINKNNIKLISNNSANNFAIKKALKIWLKGYSYPNKSDIYIFFAGHGLSSTDGKELYLLPYDGEPRLLEDTALLRSEIFNTVKSMQPKSVTVFLDTCYSGQTREKDMILADARPIAIVPVESDVPENFTVFSASSGSEISGSLPEADHGLFSYFLMKGLEGDADANNDKKITNGELHSYVRSNVTRQAVRLGREQTPEVKGDLDRVLVEFN